MSKKRLALNLPTHCSILDADSDQMSVSENLSKLNTCSHCESHFSWDAVLSLTNGLSNEIEMGKNSMSSSVDK